MNEEKDVKKDETEVTDGNPDKGDKPKADEELKRINDDTEGINKAIADNENAKARAKLGGVALKEKAPEKKELSDKEYYDKNR